MKKLGVQWQQGPPSPNGEFWPDHPVVRYNRKVQPTVLKGINYISRAGWQGLKNENPTAILVYRHYPDFPWQDDPERQAGEAVKILLDAIGIPENHDNYLLDVITAVECNNEFVHDRPEDQALHPLADRYMAEFVFQARRVLGLKTVVLNSACGHFNETLVDKFPRTWNVLSTNLGWIGMHEYDWPTMDCIYRESGDYWLCGKFRKAIPPIRAKYGNNIHCLITECGVDGGVAGKPRQGWRASAGNEWDAMNQYLGDHSLGWFNGLLNEADYVDGACIFGLSMEDTWREYDIYPPKTITERIAAFPGVEIPEPNNGGNGMKVYNRDGILLSDSAAQQMAAYYGVSWERPPGLQNGDVFFDLVALREKGGDSGFIHRILNADRQPIQRTDIRAFWWPNMGDANDITEAWATDIWHPDADLGETNVNGEGASGMGTGAYHGVNTAGPHHAWVRDQQYKSVILRGIGMIAGTNHDHMDAEWNLVAYSGGEEPEPPQGDLAAELDGMGDRLKEIAQVFESGGVTVINVIYADGTSQQFKPVVTSLLARAVAWLRQAR